jgi:hypothetical protein
MSNANPKGRACNLNNRIATGTLICVKAALECRGLNCVAPDIRVFGDDGFRGHWTTKGEFISQATPTNKLNNSQCHCQLSIFEGKRVWVFSSCCHRSWIFSPL